MPKIHKEREEKKKREKRRKEEKREQGRKGTQPLRTHVRRVISAKAEDSFVGNVSTRNSSNFTFFVKKLVFATKEPEEEAFLDYFETKLHFFVKSSFLCNQVA